MPPPFKRTYDYFVHDAKAYIRNNNIQWKQASIQSTISVIWATEQAVKHHYEGSEGSNPGPGLPVPNPIPAKAYTRTEAARAKRKKVSPAPAAESVLHQPSPNHPSGPSEGAGPSRTAGAQQGITTAQSANIEHIQESNPDRRPYNFWPQLPWPEDNVRLNVPMGSPRSGSDQVNTWLDGQWLKPNEDETAWYGARPLGYGSYGVVGFWVKLDENNNVVERMVAKDAKPNRKQWRDPTYWRSRLPQEVKIHELLEECREDEPDKCRNIIKYYGHRLCMEEMTYRLYLEYCTGGCVEFALGSESKTEGLVPEAYIWYVIKALANSLRVLQDGTENMQGWKPIMHLDVQPGNVFLKLCQGLDHKSDDQPAGSPVENPIESQGSSSANIPSDLQKDGSKNSSNEHGNNEPLDEETAKEIFEESRRSAKWKGKQPAVPKLKTDGGTRLEPILADFGFSFFSVRSDCPLKENPLDYMIHGYFPRYAPEHQMQDGPHFQILNEQTDVWGIG